MNDSEIRNFSVILAEILYTDLFHRFSTSAIIQPEPKTWENVSNSIQLDWMGMAEIAIRKVLEQSEKVKPTFVNTEMRKAKSQRLEIYVDIDRCARCGANHQHLLFKQFLSPIIDPNFSWHYWGMCPYENEPILLNIIQE